MSSVVDCSELIDGSVKHFRAIATRYDKNAANYLPAVKLVCVRIWCSTL
ncbi:hypothetical protein [Sphingomonas montanisoli]